MSPSPSAPETGRDPQAPGSRMVSRFFQAAALLEAVSWLALLIAMYVKWIADGGERGVEIAGPIHGTLFIVYVFATLIAGERLGWTLKEVVLGLAAGVPPLLTVVFERWMSARGRLFVGA